jgi:hypothetical protein
VTCDWGEAKRQDIIWGSGGARGDGRPALLMTGRRANCRQTAVAVITSAGLILARHLAQSKA